MNDVLIKLSKIGIVPVVKIDRVEDAVPLARALCDGGLPCAEVTFRTEAAKDAIKAIKKAFPQMLIGAGTVLSQRQVDDAVEAGAEFIVSPGLNPKTVRYCIKIGIPVIPGCSNPSDVEQAIALGLDVVKFFPAEALGGLTMIKAMSAPYVGMKFMPTGGINSKNFISYLNFPKIIACGGSWMVSNEMINAGEFDKITELTKEAIHIMLGFELAHVGVNSSSESEAESIADSFTSLFGMPKKVGSNSVFSGKGFEIMKAPYLGTSGHLAIATNYINRAIYYLETQGVELDMSTAKYDQNGNMIAVYIKDEIGGFAIHLLQKK